MVFYLNRRDILIGQNFQQDRTIAHGSVYPSEIVMRALEFSAPAIIIANYHEG